MIQGNWAKGIETAGQAIKIARPLGDVASIATGSVYIGYCSFMNGSREKGMAKILEAINIMTAGKIYLVFPHFYSFLAYTYARSGKLEEAKDIALKCLDWSQKTWKGWESLAYYALASVEDQKTPSDLQKVDHAIAEGLRLCKERNQTPFLAQGFYEYANILRRRGEPKKATTYLNQATKLFTEMNMGWWLRQSEELERH